MTLFLKIIVKRKMKKTNVMTVIFLIFFVVLIIIVCYLCRKIREQFQQKDPLLIMIRNQLSLLSPMAGSLQYFEDDKSYTINKNKVYLCLRDENKEYYSMNMLMYVSIHELAHVICDEIGHTPKFHKIFSELLDKAVILGIYDPSEPLVQNYCDYKNT